MILHFHRSFHLKLCKSATILRSCHARRSLGSSISRFSNHRYAAPQRFLQGSLPAALRRVLIQECCRYSHRLTRISSLRFFELCLLAILGSALRISDAHEAASRARGEARVVGEGGEVASCGEWRRGLWRTREVPASIPEPKVFLLPKQAAYHAVRYAATGRVRRGPQGGQERLWWRKANGGARRRFISLCSGRKQNER
jgi:hypothetical protein